MKKVEPYPPLSKQQLKTMKRWINIGRKQDAKNATASDKKHSGKSVR